MRGKTRENGGYGNTATVGRDRRGALWRGPIKERAADGPKRPAHLPVTVVKTKLRETTSKSIPYRYFSFPKKVFCPEKKGGGGFLSLKRRGGLDGPAWEANFNKPKQKKQKSY